MQRLKERVHSYESSPGPHFEEERESEDAASPKNDGAAFYLGFDNFDYDEDEVEEEVEDDDYEGHYFFRRAEDDDAEKCYGERDRTRSNTGEIV